MDKKGFTIIELLAVLVVITIIGSIATIGVMKVLSSSNESLLESKKDIIIEGAKLYGQDNKELLVNECTLSSGETVSNCILKKVSEITYIDLTDNCDNEKCIKNDITKKSMNEDEVAIYIKNNRVYAEFINIYSCDEEC